MSPNRGGGSGAPAGGTDKQPAEGQPGGRARPAAGLTRNTFGTQTVVGYTWCGSQKIAGKRYGIWARPAAGLDSQTTDYLESTDPKDGPHGQVTKIGGRLLYLCEEPGAPHGPQSG